MVRHLVASRQNQALDPSAILQALVVTVQQGDGQFNQALAIGAKKISKYSSKMMKASIDGHEGTAAHQHQPTSTAPTAIDMDVADSQQLLLTEHVAYNMSPQSLGVKIPDPAPAELKQSTLVKQAAMLARKFPESLSLQHMLLQMTNPKTPTADQRGILAIMVSEVQMLSQALDMDLEEA
jgi:hypothetical protein